jgi:hypothetical protein
MAGGAVGIGLQITVPNSAAHRLPGVLAGRASAALGIRQPP